MTAPQIRCQNCGAPMTASAIDGRTYACAHCDNRSQIAIDSEQLAAGMKLDLANAEAFLAQLAEALKHGFAERVTILSEGTRIISISLDLDSDMYIAKREPKGIVAQHKKMVRGVAIKTKTHPLHLWVELLVKAIAEHVNTNANAAQVLAQLQIK